MKDVIRVQIHGWQVGEGLLRYVFSEGFWKTTTERIANKFDTVDNQVDPIKKTIRTTIVRAKRMMESNGDAERFHFRSGILATEQ